jgi:hypothetical protein
MRDCHVEYSDLAALCSRAAAPAGQLRRTVVHCCDKYPHEVPARGMWWLAEVVFED